MSLLKMTYSEVHQAQEAKLSPEGVHILGIYKWLICKTMGKAKICIIHTFKNV